MTVFTPAVDGSRPPAGAAAPTRRSKRGWRVIPAALAATALVALAAALRETGGSPAAAAIGQAPNAAAFVDIRKPQRLYSLAAPELARLPQSYEARRSASGEARADPLAIGTFGGETAWLRLDGLRAAAGGPQPAGFFVEIARRAAEAGLAVTKSGLPLRLATRLGSMDLAEVTLEQHGLQARCIGWRLADSGPELRIAGLACPGAGRPLAPGAVACLVERLQPAGDGDAGLRGFFASAELKRGRFCNGATYAGG